MGSGFGTQFITYHASNSASASVIDELSGMPAQAIAWLGFKSAPLSQPGRTRFQVLPRSGAKIAPGFDAKIAGSAIQPASLAPMRWHMLHVNLPASVRACSSLAGSGCASRAGPLL